MYVNKQGSALAMETNDLLDEITMREPIEQQVVKAFCSTCASLLGSFYVSKEQPIEGAQMRAERLASGHKHSTVRLTYD